MTGIGDFIIENGALLAYIGDDIEVVIPSDAGITKIWEYAFKGNFIATVEIPEGVIEIGEGAFYDCEDLMEVTLPDSLKKIDAQAFDLCTSLTAIKIPDSVEYIGREAFHGCRGLRDSDGFVIVRDTLYNYYGNAADVIIPERVKAICRGAFMSLNTLNSITLPHGITAIDCGAFHFCHAAAIIIPDSVSQIYAEAFTHCTNLTDIVLPDSITRIHRGAFSDCNMLETLVIPDSITRIEKGTFRDCVSLTDLTIPDSIQVIEEMAFASCFNLTDIIIPEGVVKIDDIAFFYCTKLTAFIKGTPELGHSTFDYTHKVISPCLPIEAFASSKSRIAACRGFLDNMELYTDTEIQSGYTKCALELSEKLLDHVLHSDNAAAVALFAENGGITAENFEKDYLNPAIEAEATACVAFLLDWKNRNIPFGNDGGESL